MPEQEEINNSLVKTLFSLVTIPILGPALTEIFDFRGKLKQNRLNQFTELLENYFSNHAGIDLENFQTIEFSDLFESVLNGVVLTNSLEKMKMFKGILINQLENPSQSIDESEIYLDLVTELNEIELRILFEYRQFILSFQREVDEMNQLERRLAVLENEEEKSQPHDPTKLVDFQYAVGQKRKELNRLQNIYKHDHFDIDQDQFLFYKQRLFSKALLVDNGIGSIGGKPFSTMGITQFGVRFIDYVMAE